VFKIMLNNIKLNTVTHPLSHLSPFEGNLSSPIICHGQCVYQTWNGYVHRSQKYKRYNKRVLHWLAWREMIRSQAARQPQCAVKWDRNLKPKLAIMSQCTSITDRRTDRQIDGHWHHSISAICIYYISR